MQDTLSLIVGLGNPGAQYDGTRHNAGFEYVDALAQQHDGQWKADKKVGGEVCQISLADQNIVLLKPQLFMNRSGRSVAALAQFFKWAPENIMVAHDELDLNPGIARFKQGGGAGGHNGLRDIIACLGNQKQFYRLRIGIGHPGHASGVVNFVLTKAPPAERELTGKAIAAAVAETPLAASGQWAKAQNALHSFRG